MSPPSNYISRSKTVSETISLIADFRDFLLAGETITSYDVVVTVYSGIDGDPSHMLYMALTLKKGTILEQRFRLGLPGVIYDIVFSAVTSAGNTYEMSTRLAVLPNATRASPVYDVIYVTSSLYPYYFSDSLHSDVAFVSGKLLGIRYTEYLTSSVSFFSGSIVGTFIPYAIPFDSVAGTVSWIAGSIGGTVKIYAVPPDSMASGVAWLSGVIGGTAISYAILPDSMNSGISWISGGLV